jgi:uncharacterized protein
MKKIIVILSVILLLGTACMVANTLTARATEDEVSVKDGTLLTVSGTGTISIEPDTAHINIGAITDDADLTKAQSANSTAIENVIAKLKEAGVEKDDIKTINFNIYPKRDYESDSNDITGYEVRNDLEVTVKDIEKVGEILDTAIKAGANTAGSIRFSSSKSQDAYYDALAKAYETAGEKADVLVKASGMQMASTYSISEGSNAAIPFLRGEMMAKEEMASAVPIEAGMLTVSANVTVVYLLK